MAFPLNTYYISYKVGNQRAKRVVEAIETSLKRDGLTLSQKAKDADVLLLYGMSPTNKILHKIHKDKKHILIGDLGYWGRYSIRNDETHYKISYGHWHPNEAIEKYEIPTKRRIPGVYPLREFRKESPILLAGMGLKGCVLYEQKPQRWDRWAVQEIKKYTDRKIIYRPKPSWKDAPPIPGTVLGTIETDNLKVLLQECDTVVTHHSNCGIDGAIAGIGCFANDGAAKILSMKSLEDIDKPVEALEKRVELLKKISYFNWSVYEMLDGSCWNFMKSLMEQNDEKDND